MGSHAEVSTMKTVLITGGTSGIGLELVKYFDKGNYQVFFTTRNQSKADALIQEHQLTATPCMVDFSSLQSVADLAHKLQADLPSLDILINNAGTWQMEFYETHDGLEMNFAVNHLAPMLLTLELLPLLNKAPAARIINTSSGAHRRDILRFEDLEFRNGDYNGVYTYSQSKLCNILFSLHLKTLLQDTSTTVNTVHPGYVQSSLFENMNRRSFEGVPSAFEGARSAIYAAEAAELEGVSGKYYFKEAEEPRLSKLAQDPASAKTLWNKSMAYLTEFVTS